MEFIKKILIPVLLVTTVVGCTLKKDDPPKQPEQKTPKELKDNLFEAIFALEVENVRKILEDDGADPNVYDEDGHTTLMRAVQMRNPVIIDHIIKNGGKIYQPQENDESVNAFNLITDSDTEIKRQFNAEKLRLSTILETSISEAKFQEAFDFSKENYLPVGLEMPSSNLIDLELSLSKATDSTAVEYLTYLTNTHEEPFVHSLSEDYLKASAQIKDTDFLKFIVNEFPIQPKDNKPESKNKLISPFSTFTDLDAESTEWMVSKIEVLNEYSLYLDLDPISEKLLSYNTQVTPNIADRDSYIRLLSAVLKSGADLGQKRLFMQNTLLSIAGNAKSDLSYLNWIGPVVRSWEAAGLGVSEFSFDATASTVIQAIEAKAFDIDTVKSVFDDIQAFAPSLENDSEDSIKKVISGKFRQSEKLELLGLILNKTHILPKEIIAYAIETGGIESLELILSADISFNPDDQGKSVLAAVKDTNTGDTAYQLLVLLKENGITFNTSSGAEAVLYVFQKFIVQEDLTYEEPLDFLLSISPSPMSSIEKDQALTMLKQTLFASRSKKGDWDIINKIISKINTADFDGSEHYQRSLYIPGADSSYTISTSFTWDYILTMFEIYKDDNDTLDSLMIPFSKILDKFPKDYFSMSFIDEGMASKPKEFLTQNIFPLSILFSMDKVEITESLETTNLGENLKVYNPWAPKLSWSSFSENQVHYHFFQERVFWERVTRSLLKKSTPFYLPTDKSSMEFVKILVSSNQFERYPRLAPRLENIDVKLPEYEKKCIFQKESPHTGTSGVNVINNYATGSINIVGTLGKWTSLGSFEALISLKDKSCNGLDLSQKEINFLSGYIKKNIGRASKPISIANNPLKSETRRSVKQCKEIDHPHQGNLNFEYTPLGSFTTAIEEIFNSNPVFNNKDALSFLPALQECVEFSYSGYVHYYGKHFFLNNWYKCATDNSDNDLLAFFESIKDDYSLAASDADGGINICYSR